MSMPSQRVRLSADQCSTVLLATVQGIADGNPYAALIRALEMLGADLDTAENKALALGDVLVEACAHLAAYFPYVQLTPDGVAQVREATR